MMFTILFLLLLLIGASVIGSWWIERRYPPIGDFVEVQGLRLHYVRQGAPDAPTLLLVHGANSNLRDFASSILPTLARDHQVIAFDRPGYGYSQRPPGEWLDPGKVARLLLDACEQLGIQRPVVLGHSWAGSVVMSALVNMPQRVSGGVLLAGVAGHWAGSNGWTYDVGDLPLLGRFFAWTTVFPLGQFMLDGAVVKVVAPNPVPENYAKNIGVPLALRPRSFINNVQDMTRLSQYMQSLSPRYDRISSPLLMIHGAADQLVPFWNHGRRVLPVVPQAQVVRIAGAGHAPHHTHSDQVVSALSRFAR
ncbi:MAG: alpha/beta fold hydrolase [Panacagrimonas sp.]